jgi:hypothetical protein
MQDQNANAGLSKGVWKSKINQAGCSIVCAAGGGYWAEVGPGWTQETVLFSIYYYVGFRTGFLFGLVRFRCWVSVSLGLALEWPLHVGKVC